MEISIHDPREGSDAMAYMDEWRIGISIHAPREGSDQGLSVQCGYGDNFNPRSP